MPVVLGEVDIIKSLLLLPGVTNAGEGASGFNVRGGGADQKFNFIRRSYHFNSSHVFSFFPVLIRCHKRFNVIQRREFRTLRKSFFCFGYSTKDGSSKVFM
jgi:hypothetical protein